jgi:cytochrome c-type biogenesis protein CcmH/NrfG
MLDELLSRAEAGSETAVFARRHLARRLLALHPWRAAVLAREGLREEANPEDYGVLGLALSVLGHHRAAARAYRRALTLDPDHVEVCHNLGHLLDAGLDRPLAALPLLGRAYRALPTEPDVATSYARALARAGMRERARDVLERALGRDSSSVEEWLSRWTQSPAEA